MPVPSLILIKYSPAKPPLRKDAVAEAHNQHANQQLRIDRRPPDLALERRQLIVQIGQVSVHKTVGSPQQVTLRNAIFEAKLVKQTLLRRAGFVCV